MKKAVVALLLIFLAGCRDEGTSYKSVGTITGVDGRFCVCCGGYFIEIDNSQYRFYTLPPGSKIDLEQETFPIKVFLNWENAGTPCGSEEIIEVQDIRKY